MRAQLIKILLVEDDQTYADLLQTILAKLEIQIRLTHVDRLDTALRRLAQKHFDVILLDLGLPDSKGLSTLTRTQVHSPDMPIVVLTALENDELAISAVRAGAQDYLVKGQFDSRLLTHVLCYAIERKQAEEALRESERRHRQIVEQASDVVYTTDPQGNFTYINPPGQRLTGYTEDELFNMAFITLLPPEWQDRVMSFYQKQLRDQVRETFLEFPILTKTGEQKWIEQSVALLADGDEVIGFQSIARDITARKQIEIDLRDQRQLLQNLVSVARATAVFRTLEATLQSVLDVAANLTDAEMGSLFLLDQAGNVSHSIVARGTVTPPQQRKRVNRVIDNGLAGWIAHSRQSALIHDTMEDVRWLPPLDAVYTARSVLAVPIERRDTLLGILTLTHSTPAHFNDEQLTMMQAAADQMALALHNAQMYEAQRRLADRQSTLYEVLRTVGGHLDPEDIAHAAVETIARLTYWPDVVILLPTEPPGLLIARARAGQLAESEGWSASVDQGVIGRAFRTAKTQYVPDVSVDPDYVTGPPTIRSELAVPLRRGERVLGVLNVESDQLEAFDAEDIKMAESLSEAIVLALDNAELYTAVQRELVERRQAEEELRRAKDAAEAANRAKSTFLTNMSHELRTPLNAIIGYSELLREESQDLGYGDLIPDLEKIRIAGSHLLSLINDILDLSKIEAGKMELHLETFPLAPLVADVATTSQPLIAKNGNTIQVDRPDDIGHMRADLTKVRQILLNLLGNAAKFTRQGHITFSVTREMAQDGADWILFSVVDTGIGMTPEQMLNLFQPFTQAEVSTTRQYGGSGLGLAISQRFCQMMGGEITVESRVDQGSTFIARLPAQVQDDSPRNRTGE